MDGRHAPHHGGYVFYAGANCICDASMGGLLDDLADGGKVVVGQFGRVPS
jgi:hypothetical protein